MQSEIQKYSILASLQALKVTPIEDVVNTYKDALKPYYLYIYYCKIGTCIRTGWFTFLNPYLLRKSNQ